ECKYFFMVHLIKNKKGKFDLVTLSKGKVLNVTNQGFERKAGAYKNLRAVNKIFGVDHCYFQDDTLLSPGVFLLQTNGGKPQIDILKRTENIYYPGKNKKKKK